MASSVPSSAPAPAAAAAPAAAGTSGGGDDGEVSHRPSMTCDQAVALVKEHWSKPASVAKPLPSYDDLNFKIECGAGKPAFVLKVYVYAGTGGVFVVYDCGCVASD